jgi:hypothetical protein
VEEKGAEETNGAQRAEAVARREADTAEPARRGRCIAQPDPRERDGIILISAGLAHCVFLVASCASGHYRL